MSVSFSFSCHSPASSTVSAWYAVTSRMSSRLSSRRSVCGFVSRHTAAAAQAASATATAQNAGFFQSSTARTRCLTPTSPKATGQADTMCRGAEQVSSASA